MNTENSLQSVMKLAHDYRNISEENNFRPIYEWISDTTVKEIMNILPCDDLDRIRKYLIHLTTYWTIDLSSNMSNEFEEEMEIKVKDVDIVSIEKKLQAIWAKKIFEWTIDDVYLDLPWNVLEKKDYKVSLRIRFKIDTNWKLSTYYTIKRKQDKQETINRLKEQNSNLKYIPRICYEKEFEIYAPWYVIDWLSLHNLYPYRRKTKQRIAYILYSRNGKWLKFDIDTYDGLPPLLEIETYNLDLIEEYIRILWLINHKTSASWSRGFMKKEYNISKDSSLIIDQKSWLSLPPHLIAN